MKNKILQLLRPEAVAVAIWLSFTSATAASVVPFALPDAIGGQLTGVSSVSSADFDGDGDADVLAGAYGANKIVWFKNSGTGLFSAEQVIDAAAESVWFTEAGDLDGDGDLDALGGMYSGTLAWYQNNGAGVFNKQVLSTNVAGPWLEIADLDGDGRVDILAAPDGGTNVLFFRGLTNGFVTGTNIVSGFGGVGGIFVRDINGDGHRDLLLGDYRDDVLVWYLNLGGGVLGQKQTVTGGDGSGLAAVEDLDGDGKLDLVSLEYNAERVSWFKNLGNGSFGPRQVLPAMLSGPYAVTPADFDKDGDLDIAIATYSSGPDLVWLANDGAGSFSAPQLISKSFGQVSMLAAADADGDGDSDLVVGSFSGSQVSLVKNLRGEKATVVVAPADGNYLRGQYLDTKVYFGFPVTVSGVPSVDLQIGTKTIKASYVSGSGTPTLTFRYVVTEGDSDADGVALLSNAVQTNGGAIVNPIGSAANIELTPKIWPGVRVAGSAPFVVGIQRAGQTPTDLPEVSFKVTFSEDVAGFDVGDVGIVSSGDLAGVTLAGMTGGGSSYTVQVGTGIGSGTIGLTLPGSATITDISGVSLGAGYSGGEVFTLLRGSQHTITNFYPSGHGDIALGYDTNGWNAVVSSDDFGIFPLKDVLLYGGSEGLQPRGTNSSLDFIGVGAGEPVYLWPATGSNPRLPDLGVGGGGIPGGTAAAYDNADPRIAATGPWVSLRLLGFRGPTGGNISVYTTSPLGQPVVWWATADGIGANDAVTILEGSHQHYNFTFTKAGIYQVDVVISGFKDSNGNGVYEAGVDPYLESGVETLYFGVDLPGGPQPYTVAAGMSGRRPLPRFTFQTFDLPGAKETLIADIDNSGRLVGRFKDANDLSHGFFQDGTNVLKFNVTGNTATFATGFDTAGRIVGFYRDAANPDIQHGFLRQTNGTFGTIDSPANTTTTYLWRLNDAGQINGYHFEDEPFFIRSFQRAANGSFTTNIVFPGSPVGTVARGMNEAGVLTGWKWTDDFALQGVIIEGTNFTQVFTVPSWANTLPGDINKTGEIAGTVINADFSDRRGFFRTSDGRTSVFAPPGATEMEVFGLNDAGRIVGEYVDQAGKRHGFIASPVPGIDRGDTDLGIGFEDGRFNLHIHHEVTDTEYSPDQATLIVGTAAEQPIPDTLALSFLGRPGHSTWILPAVENPNLLFLGLAAEEIEKGIFVNDRLTLALVEVTGVGDVSMYTADAFGKPNVHFNTADGINASDAINLVAGAHQHVNWAFNAAGTYHIGLRASGTLVAGNQAIVSDVAYYTIEVPAALLPQPAAPDSSVYTVVDLGTFGGSAFANALGINNAGVVVGGANFPDNKKFHPYRFSGNGPKEDLGTAGGDIAGANDINEAGEITGTTFLVAGQDEPYLPFRYTTNGVMQVITNILGGLNGEAAAINEAGRIVGSADIAPGKFESVAFYADADNVMRSLGTFGGTESRAENINNAGSIVGNARLANGERRAFRHLGNGPLKPATDNLGTLGGNRSQAHAINAAGKVTGTSRIAGNGSSPAFLWEEGKGMTNLGTLGSGTLAYGFAINKDDVVVGWSLTVTNDFDSSEAFVWDREHGMRNLNDLVPSNLELRLTGAYGINDEGWIAGTATHRKTGAATPVLLKPATRVSLGDTDIGVAFEDGAFDLHVHHEVTDTEYSPAAALLQVAAVAQTAVPTAAPFRFLGDAGAPVWILPQAENPKLLFLGLAAEEITNGVFVANQVSLALKSVDGPGSVAVYTVDGFGTPQVKWNSADGLNTQDTYTLPTGGHQHVNWAFSKPGYYRIGLQASGTLMEENRPVTSDVAVYHFTIISRAIQTTLTRKSEGLLNLSTTTEDGIIYQVQLAASVGGPWSDIAQPFVGTGRSKEFNVPVATGAGFYRVITPGGN